MESSRLLPINGNDDRILCCCLYWQHKLHQQGTQMWCTELFASCTELYNIWGMLVSFYVERIYTKLTRAVFVVLICENFSLFLFWRIICKEYCNKYICILGRIDRVFLLSNDINFRNKALIMHMPSFGPQVILLIYLSSWIQYMYALLNVDCTIVIMLFCLHLGRWICCIIELPHYSRLASTAAVATATCELDSSAFCQQSEWSSSNTRKSNQCL